MRKQARQKKLKTVAYRFIQPESPLGLKPYALLRELIEAHHQEILEARIALAWHLAWQPDVDGRVTLGQCRKVSDLERELYDLAGYDFVIVLRQEFWDDPYVTDLQRRALLDHELCHASVKLDDAGEPVVDERGRTAYRLRKHDLEEFADIADRYGCWKRDLAEFARALERARQKTDGLWIGYAAVQGQLREAGLSLSVDVIATWSEAERRDASTWALVQRELQGKAGHVERRAASMPAFLRSAIAVLPMGDQSPTQDTLPPLPPAGLMDAETSSHSTN